MAPILISNTSPISNPRTKTPVDLFERYANGGDHSDLKAWAGKTVPALRHHKEMADVLPK
jgi:putative membrane protein